MWPSFSFSESPCGLNYSWVDTWVTNVCKLLTKGPSNSQTLDRRHKYYTYSIGTIVVNQLEDVHSSLDTTEECVQSQQNEHQEKAGGPQLRQRHHGNSLRKYYERKSRPWEDRRDV
ncbi:hypothetical protein EYF80_003683 [Liparis tanakae]|uniref:Uncharacterized protein n=1 Tax=Liparis tanakae TaxID=230148 RepID=A0A4Z2J7U8_9TELE|nr:hypothetical protein EYF80_003683 [Liparis tanakae]